MLGLGLETSMSEDWTDRDVPYNTWRFGGLSDYL